MRKLKWVIAFVGLAGTIFWGLLQVTKSRTFQFFGTIVSEVNTDKKLVALTFDDGPGPYTDSILHILAHCGIKATFFLTGGEIAVHSNQTEEIVSSGNDIGNHSYSHKRLIFTSLANIRNEVEKTDSLIRFLGYRKEIFFRPPYCKKFLFLPWYLAKTHRTTVTWNIEPDSKADADDNTIVNNTLSTIKPGSVILLHATYPSRAQTLKALPVIIDRLQQRGYEFVTVSELLHK